MIPILVTCLAVVPVGACQAETVYPELWASQYAPGVFDRVVAARQAGRTAKDLPTPLPDVDGFIAVVDCDQIGDIWTLRPVGQVQWETFLVADCSGHAETTAWMTEQNIICEVGHRTATRWKTVGRGIKVERSLYRQDRLFRASRIE